MKCFKREVGLKLVFAQNLELNFSIYLFYKQLSIYDLLNPAYEFLVSADLGYVITNITNLISNTLDNL